MELSKTFRFQSQNLSSFIPFCTINNNPLKNQLPFTTKLIINKPKTTRLTVTAKRKPPIEGVSEELNNIACYNLDFAYSRRRVRSAFIEVHQQLDHCLFKDAPAGIRTEERYERNSRGLEIFCKSWMPEPGIPVKASVCFCHGYGDTCTFFFEGVARRIAASGYAVFAMDYPGFGLSEGLHGYIPNFDDLVDDVIEHYTQIKARPDMRELPRFLLGQSMGGAVSLKVHLKEPNNWDGVVLVAPMCKAVYNVICYEDNPRLSTGMELLRITKEIESKVEKVSAPLFILHGAADKVTDPLVSQFLYENASSKDKTLKLYENGYHCILEGEPDDRIYAIHDDIIAWLDSRCSIK
ncbi:unnamed protein product [Trifolium pratense]|uniref:Uncharacterized protein n=1 Tax=Trifolium pratense TaxID=57577 RepID=A0ACB0JX17_TRIPR|nr:unnamed protein product [Trifolium pratense]